MGSRCRFPQAITSILPWTSHTGSRTPIPRKT
jgi:hypothetical protein